jgi:diaminopimelate epimerase
MEINFHKYQGTGNDFVMLDNRDGKYNQLSIAQIQLICDRRFGIGADGLICINKHENYAFEVDYSNSDGSKSFCGNGARCSVAFAAFLGIDCESVTFLAIDGEHQAKMNEKTISIEMQNVIEIKEIDGDFELNTGSPHYIRFIDKDEIHDVVEFGKLIRYSAHYQEHGINVNLVQQIGNAFNVETYERGVEDETFSCGTGVTAAAIACAFREKQIGFNEYEITVKGGKLKVSFVAEDNFSFTNIWLSGPAEFVFKGMIHV